MLYIFVNHIIFKDIAISLKDNLNSLGLNIQLTSEFYYDTQEKDLYIIFGSHLLIDNLPNNYIIYQLEQSNVSIIDNQTHEIIEQNYRIFNHKYLTILQNAKMVWDYSNENIDFFAKLNQQLTPNIFSIYVPICYSSYLTQYKQYLSHHDLKDISQIKKEIDILFIGNMNDRRKYIIDKLIKLGYTVEYYNYLYDEETKLEKILKSKIILNIHYYENSLLETDKLNYLLANKCFIISETSRDKIEDYHYMNSLIFTSYQKMIETCQQWLNNSKKEKDIQIISNHGFNLLKNRKINNYIDLSILNEYNETIQLTKSQLKRYKQKLNKQLNYYIPTEIKQAETEITKDNQFILKSLDIDEDNLPHVSIITPTKNRRKLFSIAIKNYQQFIYPRDKLEWIIIDDGEEDLSDIIPKDNTIKYLRLDNNKSMSILPIGKKRNICIENTKYDYIVCMDDDDYYTPESILARIKTMLKYNIKCVGCQTVGNYDLIKRQSRIASNGEQYLCEASLAFHKSFWLERKFNDIDKYAEYRYFLHHRQNNCVSIPFQFIMIALSHGKNTTGNKQIIDNKKNDSLLDILNEEDKIFIHDLIKYIQRN